MPAGFGHLIGRAPRVHGTFRRSSERIENGLQNYLGIWNCEATGRKAAAATLDLDQMANRGKRQFCASECAEAGMKSSSTAPGLPIAGLVTTGTCSNTIDRVGRRA